ncbi:hypothetical protein B0T16DRAFT_517789 [Cercophora newfieldiana]|uniref:Uncharacterized protein n=1 Tax=Cercophora newfieldiana TaxID=92897 RepID=A0AA39XRV9_9PEZI|nr:hypothetical protein B0T16DRAFT_517789 [Cercophora newfieldiana]
MPPPLAAAKRARPNSPQGGEGATAEEDDSVDLAKITGFFDKNTSDKMSAFCVGFHSRVSTPTAEAFDEMLRLPDDPRWTDEMQANLMATWEGENPIRECLEAEEPGNVKEQVTLALKFCLLSLAFSPSRPRASPSLSSPSPRPSCQAQEVSIVDYSNTPPTIDSERAAKTDHPASHRVEIPDPRCGHTDQRDSHERSTLAHCNSASLELEQRPSWQMQALPRECTRVRIRSATCPSPILPKYNLATVGRHIADWHGCR